MFVNMRQNINRLMHYTIYIGMLFEYETLIVHHNQDIKGWTLTPAQIKTANKRSNDLGGEPNWLPLNLNLMTKTFKLKAVDFVRLSKGAMSYVFKDVFDGPTKEKQKQAFDSFNESLRLCLTTHFNVDGKPITHRMKMRAARLTEQVTETMSLLEMSSPVLIFDRLVHELLHVPLALLKWDSCRIFWSFPSERYTNNKKPDTTCVITR
jgi:hypothetical protein